MGLLNMFDKLDDIIYEPIKLLTDWAREPIERKKRRDERQTEADRDERRAKHEAEAEIRKSELKIRGETEVVRILADIEEMKKDREFARMKQVSAAIMKYQRHLTRLNVEAAYSIGSMQLDLKARAQTLVLEKTQRYKELQDEAYQVAMRDIARLEDELGQEHPAYTMMLGHIDGRLSQIIETAGKFLDELNNDIRLINGSIQLLTENGQEFIQRHLSQFHQLRFTESTLQELGSGAPARKSLPRPDR